MSYFGEYILKLSISFGIICLFFQVILKRLTFYNWNRFYLMGCTFMCFFIPLINIPAAVQRNDVLFYKAIEYIPSIVPQHTIVSSLVVNEDVVSWFERDWLLLIFISGVILMMVRLLMQFISLRQMVRKSELISATGMKLYQVNSRIIPFTFGASVFINRQLHKESDLEKIIRHEFVHVRQKHSIDIIWAEVLCVFNWYNPFIWWLRSSIKQNLEYIADNIVLQEGTDKKQYQYLLLKVMGDHRFAVASSFNFSSLKKRITMMNKMKTASIHLLKFMFIIPLMAIMIMAFRKDQTMLVNKETLSLSGITFDKITELPISGVTVKDSASGVQTISDKNGFYTITIPVDNKRPLRVHVDYQKKDYPLTIPLLSLFSSRNGISKNMIVLSGLVNVRDINREVKPSLHYFSSTQQESDGYLYAKKIFKDYFFQKRIDMLVQNSTKPIWIIDGTPYAIMKNGKAWFNEEEIAVSPECKVWCDGKIMSIGEANNLINRFDVKNVGAMSKAEAKKKLGIDCNVLMLAKDSIIP